MTNLEERPPEVEQAPVAACGPTVQLLEARDVPLGGLRAMTVRRTLPQRARSTVGAWCFVDRFGPDDEAPMRVLPHPHTGLQTVTWPIAGEIHHRDSLGSDEIVRPGELNLMTAGRGVSHSELSVPGSPPLSGVQLWVALPDGVEEAGFERLADLPRLIADGVVGTVFIGELAGVASPAVVHSPLLGAELRIEPGATARFAVRPDFEHAVLVTEGSLTVDGVSVEEGPLAFLGMQREEVRLQAGPDGARCLLLGGTPFTEPLVMFWNFIGRTHEDVAQARADWEADAGLPLDDQRRRFGTVAGHDDDRIPAPPVPEVRLRPRTTPTPPG